MATTLSQQMGSYVVFVFGIIFIMNLVLQQKEELYDNSVQRITLPNREQRQILTISEEFTASKGSHECSVVHPKLNSCNTLPNYYLYAERREEFQSAIINFWHIQKSGGSSVEDCFNGMQPKLNLPPAQRGSAACEQLEETFPKLTYFRNVSYKPVIQGHNTLGLCDFFHETLPERKCSTFAIFREPYERAVSHYYFARKVAAEGNPNEGYQKALIMPITEWVKLDGSPAWVAFSRIWNISLPENGGIQCEMISEKVFGQKWPLNETIIDEIIGNLDKHLSFVGLLEDMSTTYEMLEEIYNLPFVEECYGRHLNKGSYEDLNATAKHELEKKAKRTLMEDEEIKKLMTFDVRLYERAKEIFNSQKNIRTGG